jgi:hypothetical protein
MTPGGYDRLQAFMKYVFEMALCDVIQTQSFMKTGGGVQATLRFILRNLRGCNVELTDRSHLQITPLRRAQVPR